MAPPGTPAVTTQPSTPGVTPNRPDARRLDELRSLRQQQQVGGRTIIQEPGRTIIREGDRTIVRHDEAARFSRNARDVQVLRRGANTETVVVRPDGSRIITVVDDNGRCCAASAATRGRDRDHRQRAPARPSLLGSDRRLAAAGAADPRERYIVEAESANPVLIYETLTAPPVDRIDAVIRSTRSAGPRAARPHAAGRYRHHHVRHRFLEITPDQAQALSVIAQAMLQAIQRNPRTVLLIEGHTDAVGLDVDNLSLSDRRAEAVAQALSTSSACRRKTSSPRATASSIRRSRPRRRNAATVASRCATSPH